MEPKPFYPHVDKITGQLSYRIKVLDDADRATLEEIKYGQKCICLHENMVFALEGLVDGYSCFAPNWAHQSNREELKANTKKGINAIDHLAEFLEHAPLLHQQLFFTRIYGDWRRVKSTADFIGDLKSLSAELSETSKTIPTVTNRKARVDFVANVIRELKKGLANESWIARKDKNMQAISESDLTSQYNEGFLAALLSKLFLMVNKQLDREIAYTSDSELKQRLEKYKISTDVSDMEKLIGDAKEAEAKFVDH